MTRITGLVGPQAYASRKVNNRGKIEWARFGVKIIVSQ